MITFPPPSARVLKAALPRLVVPLRAQRDAYARSGQPLYTPPGSDLARGILSRSPLAARLLASTIFLRASKTVREARLTEAKLIACLALNVPLAVTFQTRQMNVLFASPEGNTPLPLTLAFRPNACSRLRHSLYNLPLAAANFCFGGAAVSGLIGDLLLAFPAWQFTDLAFSRLPTALRCLPCLELLNLILCCEVGHCPARLFQLLGFSARDAVAVLTQEPREKVDAMRARLERTLSAPFVPPPAVRSPRRA